LRGLPFQASKQDILDFFQEYNPIESSVLLTYRGDGRSTGEGYVAFKDADDAKEAMALHRSTIGSRYIELFISNKEEHARNVARSNPR
jgi:heterogeneous nuclear ribonucleoprotein F/H